MAEEKPSTNSTVAAPATNLSYDDMSALEYVLEHVRGSSPTSVSSVVAEEFGE